MDLISESVKPIYMQIAEIIEDMILKDEIKENEQVFSTNQLSKIYGINPATARKGLNLLVDEGILYKKRGVGMFIDEKAKEYIQKKRKKDFFENYILDMMREASKLGLSKKEIIEFINSSNI